MRMIGSATTMGFSGILILACLGMAGAGQPENVAPKVDFSYAFGTPHRLTVGLPDSSDRTLLDLQPASLRMAWSYDDLTRFPLNTFRTPPTLWDIRITPQVDGRGLAKSRWARCEGYLPALENVYEDPQGVVRLEVSGGTNGAITRIELTNPDKAGHQYLLRCDSASWGENPAWLDPGQWPGDHLLAGWNERADRILLLGIGADAYSLEPNGQAPAPKTLLMVWNLKPGERRTAWLVRPYRAFAADVARLRTHDWGQEVEAAKRQWKELLGRASRLVVPDPGVESAFRACLADLFIMREPVADGYIAAVPGTECYRAANSGEAGIVSVALDQLGLHEEAVRGYRMCLDMQGPDGNWADPSGWCHRMWCISGFKANALMEHYRLTGDRKFLEAMYPRMVASSRWQEQQRARTRVAAGDKRPLTYGLMPRGFGDCGLMNDGDMYGVFFPHNIWSVYADRLSVEAAEILGRSSDLPELRRIHDTAQKDLLAALEQGAIREKDHRWIPGVPGKTS